MLWFCGCIFKAAFLSFKFNFWNTYEWKDSSLPGPSVHGILQARILEQIAMLSSRGPSRPRDQTHVSYVLHWQADSLPLAPLENLQFTSK